MSTLKVATIQDTSGNNSSTPAGIASGTAKAWVNFNGIGTVAIRDSFNVSSLTDHGQGDHQVSFTNAIGNANYCAQVSCGDQDDWDRFAQVYETNTSYLRMRTVNNNSDVLRDQAVNCATIFSD